MAQGVKTPPLTDEVLEHFLNLLKAGNYVKTSAALSGIREDMVYTWMREANKEGGRQWCRDFADKVNEAKAFAQASNLQLIRKAAANGTWQASAWFLERSDPEHWGRNERREVAITLGPVVSSRDRLAEALASLADEIDADDDDDDFIEVSAHELEPGRRTRPPARGGARPSAGLLERSAAGRGRRGRVVVRRTA